MDHPIRTLLFSTLYPSSARPNHGIFVETRLRHLLSSHQVETKVIAPVPWFPSTHPHFGHYSRYAATPKHEIWNDIEVFHPRYLLPPKLGMTIAPLLLALGAYPTIRCLLRSGFDFNLIDAHYYYPDGVAATLLARWLGKPFVVTARGTDLNLIPQYALPRRMIRWTADQAQASIGVCSALMEVLRDLGAPPEKLHVLRNGVDLDRFRPLDQQAMRAELGLPKSGVLILSVGNLVKIKGHHFLINALTQLPEAHLLIIGDGEERANLANQIAECGLNQRAHLIGTVPNIELVRWYSAADILALASSREGWANVLLESMACGTPVVATHVGGSPEVMQDAVAGRLVAERSAEAFAQAIRALLRDYPDRAAVRRYAEGFSWEETTEGQIALFNRIANSLNAKASPLNPSPNPYL